MISLRRLLGPSSPVRNNGGITCAGVLHGRLSLRTFAKRPDGISQRHGSSSSPPKPRSSAIPLRRSLSSSTASSAEDVPMRLFTEWIPNDGTGAVGTHRHPKNGNTDYYGSTDVRDRYCIVFLHGLLGNGRNLKSFAKRVVVGSGSDADAATTGTAAAAAAAAAYCWGGVLVDLRGHGRSYDPADVVSPSLSPSSEEEATARRRATAHTFRACVGDVSRTLREMRAGSLPPVRVVVGHSWGGRLALQYVAEAVKARASSSAEGIVPDVVEALWLLDTVPGQANENVERVIRAAAEIRGEERPLNRKELTETLTEKYGMDGGVAQWLASSYNVKTGDFGFDLDLVKDIQPEFASQDFVGLLRQILEGNDDDSSSSSSSSDFKPPIQVHLVRGGKNTAWTVPILNELQGLAREFPSTFHIHVLPKAGHWVHVDDLPGLAGLFETYRH